MAIASIRKFNPPVLTVTVLAVVILGFVIFRSLAGSPQQLPINARLTAPAPPAYGYTSPETASRDGAGQACLIFLHSGKDANFQISSWVGKNKTASQNFLISGETEGSACLDYPAPDEGQSITFRVLVETGTIFAKRLELY